MKSKGMHFIVAACATLLVACGGGGEPEEPPEPEVLGLFLIPEGASNLDDERLQLPPGSRSWAAFETRTSSGNQAIFHAVPGISCTSSKFCTNRNSTALIQSLVLQTSAPITLESWDEDRIRLVVGSSAPVGSIATLTVTDATGREISRAYEVR